MGNEIEGRINFGIHCYYCYCFHRRRLSRIRPLGPVPVQNLFSETYESLG